MVFITEDDIIGVADLSEEAFAEVEKLINEKRIERDIAFGQEDLREIEEKARTYIKNLNTRMKQDLRAVIANYLKAFEHAQNIEDVDSMNNFQTWIQELLIIKNLKLPPTFDFQSIQSTLKITGDSKEAIDNREFLHQLKKDYEKIPLRLKGEGSPEIFFYDRVTDYRSLQSLKTDPSTHNALGIYLENENIIIIATNYKLRRDNFDEGPTLAHEMGHYIYLSKGLNELNEWKDIYNTIKDELIKTGDEQASENAEELFADAFAEYYTGIIREKRIMMNMVRLDLDNNLIFTQGILNDYPLVKDFMIKYLG